MLAHSHPHATLSSVPPTTSPLAPPLQALARQMFVAEPEERWLLYCRAAEKFPNLIRIGLLDPDDTVDAMRDLAKRYFLLERDPEGWHLVQAILFVIKHADDRGAR
jgi:hypothetical protein